MADETKKVMKDVEMGGKNWVLNQSFQKKVKKVTEKESLKNIMKNIMNVMNIMKRIIVNELSWRYFWRVRSAL